MFGPKTLFDFVRQSQHTALVENTRTESFQPPFELSADSARVRGTVPIPTYTRIVSQNEMKF